MMNSRICEMLDIEFPLVAFTHCRDVVVAVSKAGGCGVLGAVGMSPEQLEKELKWIDEHIDGKPYGVDVLIPNKMVGKDEKFDADKLAKMIPQEYADFRTDVLENHGIDAPELRKIDILKSLNISTSYNLVSDEFKWSPVRLTGSFDIAPGFTVNTGATFDLYSLDDNNIRINELNVKNGGGLFRLTSANLTTQYSLNNNTFKGGQILESTSGGGRADDLFGVSQDFSDSRQSEDEDSKEVNLTNYRYSIPWTLNLAYSLTYNNSRGQNDFSTNSLMFSSNLSLTPKWKVGISSGYDFKQKGFTYTQFRFDRDLDSWRLDFSWVPFSERASWNFFIGIKSGLLSDLKYEKRSEPDRSL